MPKMKSVLRQRRFDLDLTLRDVAAKVGVNVSTVQRWESGTIENLTSEKIARLATALQTTPEYLLGWTSDPELKFQDDLAAALAELSPAELESVRHYITFLITQRRRG